MNGLRDRIKRVRMINVGLGSSSAPSSATPASATITWKCSSRRFKRRRSPAVQHLADSGEILDLTVVRSDVLTRPDESGQKFAKALTGAWFEMLARMSAPGEAGDGYSPPLRSAGLACRLRNSWPRRDVLHTAVGCGVRDLSRHETKMALVRQFVFDHGLLGTTRNLPTMWPSSIRMDRCRAKRIGCV
jgi:NitT/TauT family transport system substrate-binding protein